MTPQPFTLSEKPSNVFMVDIETAGLSYGSAIIQIAAAEFDPSTGAILREWSTRVSLVDCNRHSLGTEPETLAFHKRHGTSFDQGIDLWRALNTLYVFLHLHASDEIEVWAWGLDFETLHLKAASEAVGFAEMPWKYWQGRDARTVWNLAFPGEKPAKRPHDAAQDVRQQIADLSKALNHLLIDDCIRSDQKS